MFQSVDLSLFHKINGLAGQWFLDSLVDFEEQFFLLKGALVMGAYLWLWFERPNHGQEKQREVLLSMLAACFTAIFAARLLANTLPFRTRPMFADPLFNRPSFPIASNFERWSSFPSDHAAMFFALAVGAYYIWRQLGVLLILYTILWVCLPRIYLGVHYPSDIVVGAVIGGAFAWIFLWLSRTSFFRSLVLEPILSLERNRPPIFYTMMFGIMFEMAMMFSDVRYAARHSGFMLHLSTPKELALLTLIGTILFLLGWIFWRRVKMVAAIER